jgi:hypothetical protein
MVSDENMPNWSHQKKFPVPFRTGTRHKFTPTKKIRKEKFM